MSKGNVGQAAENAAAAYRMILLIRRFEEKAGQLYAMGLIPDEIKLCIGREALFAGLNAARRDGDPLIVGRRCHGALLAFGLAPERIMGELANPSCGLFDRPSQRSDTSACRPADFYRCPTNNADRTRWAISLAMAQSLSGNQTVVFVVLDGDTLGQDHVQRSFVLATRLQLPIVFVIDHAAPDPGPGQACRDAPSRQIQQALNEYPISFTAVDGIDPQTVQTACQSARDAACAGAGPHGLLISTQVFRSHASQRSAATPDAASQTVHDPVVVARQQVIDTSDGRTDTTAAIEKDVRTTMTAIGLNVRASAEL